MFGGCFTPSGLVWWVFGVTVNIAVGGAIAILYNRSWPVSLAVSVAYALALSLVTRHWYLQEVLLVRESGFSSSSSAASAEVGVEDSASTEDGITGPEPESDVAEPGSSIAKDVLGRIPIPVYLSLLCGLLALSMGVPGAILATKATPSPSSRSCYSGFNEFEDKNPTWVTNVSLLPEAVQDWNAKRNPDYVYRGGRNYAQVNDTAHGTATVYFSGSPDIESLPVLLVMSPESAPRQVGSFVNPAWLTTVANKYVCFRVRANESLPFEKDDMFLYCGDEVSGFQAAPKPFKKGALAGNFVDIDGILWFEQMYPDWYAGEIFDIKPANGYAILSVDPADLANITVHSTLLAPGEYHEKQDEPTENDDDCFSSDDFYLMTSLSTAGAVCALFLAALPVTVMSGWMWWRKAIPSSSVTLFLSGGLLLGSLMSIGNPYGGVMDGVLTWMIFATPLWLIVCSYVLSVTTRLTREPLEWSVYILSLGLFAFATYGIFEIDYETLHFGGAVGEVLPTAIVLLLFVFFPLCLIGIMVGSHCVFLLGAVGVLVDIANATYMLLRESSITAGTLIAFECLFVLVGTARVCQTRDNIRNILLGKLRQCTGYVFGSKEEEGDDTESFLNSESETGTDPVHILA